MTDALLFVQATKLGQLLKERDWMIATAESCTGGWIAETITSVPNSSHWFDRGFVTYTNEAKHEMLGVDMNVINTYGAVSEQTVRQMAEGALKFSRAKCSIAVSGIAGPTGGSAEKPVGTVWCAWAFCDRPTRVKGQLFHGDRYTIRLETVKFALYEVIQALKETDDSR